MTFIQTHRGVVILYVSTALAQNSSFDGGHHEETSFHTRSLAAFITTTSEFRFSVHTGLTGDRQYGHFTERDRVYRHPRNLHHGRCLCRDRDGLCFKGPAAAEVRTSLLRGVPGHDRRLLSCVHRVFRK